MKPDAIKDKIQEIKKIVEGFDEPYKTESFKILLNKAINESPTQNLKNITTDETQKSNSKESEPLLKLAQACNMTLEQLMDILDFENEKFTLLRKIGGKTDTDKQITASLIILTAWAKGMNMPWIKTTELGDALRENSINTKHLGENLGRTEYFVLKGTKRAAKYHITTQGWQKGLEILKSMKSEQ